MLSKEKSTLFPNNQHSEKRIFGQFSSFGKTEKQSFLCNSDPENWEKFSPKSGSHSQNHFFPTMLAFLVTHHDGDKIIENERKNGFGAKKCIFGHFGPKNIFFSMLRPYIGGVNIMKTSGSPKFFW